MEELLEVLRREGLEGDVVDDGEVPLDAPDAPVDIADAVASDKRTDLGVYLTLQRRHQL